MTARTRSSRCSRKRQLVSTVLCAHAPHQSSEPSDAPVRRSKIPSVRRTHRRAAHVPARQNARHPAADCAAGSSRQHPDALRVHCKCLRSHCSPGLRLQIVQFESELRDLVMAGPFTSAAKQAHACPESFSRRPHADCDRHHSVRDVCAHALAMRLRGFDTFACGSPSHGTGRKAQTRTRRMSRAGSAGSLDGQ